MQQLSVAGILPCRIAWHLAAVSAKGSQKGKDDRRQDDSRDSSKQVVLRKRPKKGLLAGLYEFPAMDKKASLEEVREWLKKQGVEAVRMEKLPESKHIFTHKEWHMTGYQVLVDELEPMGQDESLLFVETQEIEKNYPIPSAFAAYSAYLRIQTGIQKMKGTTL